MCEMCSSESKDYKIELEGSVISVCEKCSRYGRIIAEIKPEPFIKGKKSLKNSLKSSDADISEKTTETIQVIVPECASIVKKGRERLGLKQDEFAKKINEKESLIHKIESGQIKPSIDLARKLEKFLKAVLVEDLELESFKAEKKLSLGEGLTIGDLIKVKKR